MTDEMKGVKTIKTTVNSVAELAGVSKATAARILGGYAGTRSKARDKVLKAAEVLGYTPNKLAKSLASRRSYKIGVILPDIENQYFARLYRGIEGICHKEGFTLVLSISGEDPDMEHTLLHELLSEQVEGIIIAPSDGLKQYLSFPIPVVSVDRIPEISAGDVSWVSTNNYESSFQAAEHLIEAGYKKIALIVNLPHISTTRERLSGVTEAVRFSDAQVPTFVTTSYLLDRIVPEITEFLREVRPDAAIVSDTVICTAVVIAARELGIRLGLDLGLVTYDDEPWMSLVEPPITAIRQPVFKMGEIAAGVLLEKLAKATKTAKGALTQRLPSTMIIRRSSQQAVVPSNGH